MDDKTEQLIRELAEQLGTTTEHLWGVLVTQAPISSATDIVVIGLWIWGLVLGARFICRNWAKFGELSMLMTIGWGVLTGIVVLAIGLSASTIIAGFLNPEYWALKELGSILR